MAKESFEKLLILLMRSFWVTPRWGITIQRMVIHREFPLGYRMEGYTAAAGPEKRYFQSYLTKWVIILILALSWILLSCRLGLAQVPPSATTINTGQTHSETGESEIEKEHGEADPYKIHQEYMSEPWRQSSSYGILHRYCITLISLNLFLFIINSLRKRERFKRVKISGKGVSNAEQ